MGHPALPAHPAHLSQVGHPGCLVLPGHPPQAFVGLFFLLVAFALAAPVRSILLCALDVLHPPSGGLDRFLPRAGEHVDRAAQGPVAAFGDVAWLRGLQPVLPIPDPNPRLLSFDAAAHPGALASPAGRDRLGAIEQAELFLEGGCNPGRPLLHWLPRLGGTFRCHIDILKHADF